MCSTANSFRAFADMHELGITRNVVAIVEEHAGGQRVTRVTLEIGKLSGVMAEAVRFCFDVCTQGTLLEGAALEIWEPAGEVTCRRCGKEFTVQRPYELCACGSAALDVRSGAQLKVKTMETV